MARTEDDLRAAFRLAAQQAPSTDDVLARLRAAEAPPRLAATRPRRPRVRQWLPAVAVAAAVIAIAVPVGFAVSSGGSGSKASSGSAAFGAAGGENKADSAASAAASAAASGEAVAPQASSASAPGFTAGRVCTPADVSLTLTWTQVNGGLRGALSARNTSAAACDLAVKPTIYPLDAKDNRLPVQQISTAEGYAGPSRLLPGATATSTITWPSWCGTTASDKVDVEWGTGTAAVTASGPTTPSCVNGASANLSSTWFGPLS